MTACHPIIVFFYTAFWVFTGVVLTHSQKTKKQHPPPGGPRNHLEGPHRVLVAVENPRMVLVLHGEQACRTRRKKKFFALLEIWWLFWPLPRVFRMTSGGSFLRDIRVVLSVKNLWSLHGQSYTSIRSTCQDRAFFVGIWHHQRYT